MSEHNYLFKTFPVTGHTDFVGVGSTFVALKGNLYSGIDFIPLAIEKGATTIVIQTDDTLSPELMASIAEKKITLRREDDVRLMLALLSADAAGYPAKKLKIIGITGTKGKTTTTFLLAHFLRKAGYAVAYMSTVHNAIFDIVYPTQFTTSQADYIHQFLAKCVEQKIEYVVMEVAAQALSMQRVQGIEFDGVIFTNFDHEHLEFYHSMDAYFAAKMTIFLQTKKDAPCIINGDDPWLQKVTENQKSITFGQGSCNDIVFSCTPSDDYTFSIKNELYRIQSSSRICGIYNGYNLAAVMGMVYALGITIPTIESIVREFNGVPGRFELYYLSNGARAIIDYAHNPSSFKAVIQTARSLTHHLIVLFGAGGGRDQFKRPEMGKIAAEYADLVVLTTDNPRDEDPLTIIDHIIKGIPLQQQQKVVIALDRQEAIKTAYNNTQDGSIILLLGKGPDEYQIIGNTKHFFSERSILQTL